MTKYEYNLNNNSDFNLYKCTSANIIKNLLNYIMKGHDIYDHFDNYDITFFMSHISKPLQHTNKIKGMYGYRYFYYCVFNGMIIMYNTIFIDVYIPLICYNSVVKQKKYMKTVYPNIKDYKVVREKGKTFK